MGGLKICLVLCLGYLVATQHQHNQHNEAAKKTSETNFEDLGRFRKSAIGSSVNGITKHRGIKKVHYPSSVNLVKEFAEFKQKNNALRQPEVPNEKERRSKDDTLERVNQLESLIVTKGDSRSEPTTKTSIEDSSTSKSVGNIVEDKNETSNKTTQTTDESEIPKTLGLTSDSHLNRGKLKDLNQNDGTFVVGVVGVALVCIVAVVGVGLILHRPACPRSSSPLSDCSPTFHSAKLAFSSRSPDDKISNSKQLSRNDAGNMKRKSSNEEPEKSFSRAFKFRENTDNNNHQGQMYNYKGTPRQESLIDIDGPEEDDDFIYECPGLAPHGEMEVTNPFFLQKDFNMNMDHTAEAEEKSVLSVAGGEAQPCPINTDTIRHGNIVRNIKPGQQ